LQNQAGQPIPVVVTEVKDEVVVLDANHELAGKELIFDIELVEIS
jgi:FKBP-type peptidyl-prolyl cis-trans isomerase 2